MEISVIAFSAHLLFLGIICFIFLSSFIVVDKTFPTKTLEITMRALISGLLLLIADAVNLYLEKQQINNLFRLIVVACGFSFKISCSGFCVSISQRTNSKIRKELYAIILLNAVISFISIPTGWLFFIKPDFSVGHGPLYFIPYLAILNNCIILTISGIKNFRNNKGETVIIFSMIIFSYVATYLEVVHRFRLMLPLTFIICIIFYFMSLNVQLYRRDTLTQLLNRRSFFMDARRHAKKNMHVISLDLNDLKYFNDTFGHSAGDDAITSTSRCMELAFSHHGTVYRTGGDEFMVLLVNKHDESVDDCIETFKLLLSKTQYSVAYGVSKYKYGDNFEAIVAESDARMYKNKLSCKRRNIREAAKRLPELGIDSENINLES